MKWKDEYLCEKGTLAIEGPFLRQLPQLSDSGRLSGFCGTQARMLNKPPTMPMTTIKRMIFTEVHFFCISP